MSKATAKKQTVAGYIAALPPSQKAAAKALRQIIRKAAPSLQEAIKWGVPCYCHCENVCSIMAYKNYVNLAFFRGADLTDAKGLLEGTGKGMRHVKIHSAKGIAKGAISALVKRAARLAK